MKRIALLGAMLCFVYAAIAQKTIKGKVFDRSTKTPLSGATVSFSNKGGVTTDKNGEFTIECGKTNRITVTFVGYEPYSVDIKDCDATLNIPLNASSEYMANVEISATSSQNKSMLYQPAAISKLSTTELKRGNGLFLDDAINTSVPGVTMNRRAVSSGQQFFIRGYGNGSRGTRGVSSNFDGQGYKVYLNGIPITDAEGIVVMDDIDFGSIGNVEVIKGPAGTLYGLAIAGAVNLHTIKPEKGKTAIGQEVMVGNYGLTRFTTHFQTAGEHSSVLANYGHQESDGFTIHNKSHKDFVNVATEFQPNEKQSIMAYFGFSNSYDQRSGELTVAQYNGNDFSGNPEYIKRNAHSTVISARGGLGHTYVFSSHVSNTTTLFVSSLNTNASSAGGWTDKVSMNYGFRSTFDTKFSGGKNVTISGITGIENQRQNAQTIGYSMKVSPFDNQTTTANPWVWGRPYYVIDATTSNNATVTGTTSIFTEWTLALPKGLSFTGGIGLSNQLIQLDDRFNATTVTRPSHYDTTYKGMVSPHLAINKVFNDKISAYASYSKGYKAPVSSYFFITTPAVTTPPTPVTSRINSVLEPEIGNQFEIGTKGNLLKSRLNYQLALFHTVFSKKMTTVAVPLNSTATAYTYVVNGGKQDHKGIELFLRYNVISASNGFFTAITPFWNFTYSDFKYEDFKFQTGTTVSNTKTYDFSGSPVAGVSKVVSAEGVDVMTRIGLYGNIVHLYRNKMPVTSPDTLYTGSYSLINGKIGFRRNLSRHWDMDVNFGVNNIGGVKYPIMVFVNQIPDAFIAGPRKANYFAAIKIDYIF
jgi:iron complex outermembrane receptor protein